MSQYDTTPIEGKEAEVENIHDPFLLLRQYNHPGLVNSSSIVWCRGTIKPSRALCNVSIAGEIYVRPSLCAKIVEPVQIAQRHIMRQGKSILSFNLGACVIQEFGN